MAEVWRDVPGYVGLYMVSDQGRVVSLEKVSPDSVLSGIRIKKKIRALNEGYAGRMGVVLCRGGKIQRIQLHRLILMAFVRACPEGMECRHMDGNHLNNVLSNLEWGTHTDNMRDKVRHGTERRGEDSAASKLTENMVRAIRLDTRTNREVAKDYGVSNVTIHMVRKRAIWKHVI